MTDPRRIHYVPEEAASGERPPEHTEVPPDGDDPAETLDETEDQPEVPDSGTDAGDEPADEQT